MIFQKYCASFTITLAALAIIFRCFFVCLFCFVFVVVVVFRSLFDEPIWCLNVILKICISLIMQEVEHCLIYLLTNCVFSFVSGSLPIFLYIVSVSLINLNFLHNEVIISLSHVL